MKNYNFCEGIENGFVHKNIYECSLCGNHVCKTCATLWQGVCPHCFGKLYRIS